MRSITGEDEPADQVSNGGRVICVTSGKGGTGKSTVSVNLATLLADAGHRVTLVDADLGLANAHLLLGVAPTAHLLHLLESDRDPHSVMTPTPYGFELLSGGSGIQEIAALAPVQLFRLMRKLERQRQSSDYVVIDTSAGISPQTLLFLYATREIVLVVTPDLTSMTDGYAVIKTLFQRSAAFRVSIVVNRCESAAQGSRIFNKLESVARKFVGSTPTYLGFLREDGAARSASEQRRPIVHAAPGSSLARGLGILADRLVDRPGEILELPRAIREVLPGIDLELARPSRVDRDRRRRRGRQPTDMAASTRRHRS